LAWAFYRSIRGSLNPGVMTELSVASFSAVYSTSLSKNKKFSMWDFTPHFDKPEPKEVSIEDFYKAL